MGFLNNKQSSVIEFTVPVGKAEAEKIQQFVKTIIENTNTEELEIISKISKNSLVKKQALNKAREYV